MSFTDKSTPSLHFTDKGTGTPLVLLHGFCESLMVWEKFEDVLSRHFRVICVDLPGFGKSPVEYENPTIDNYAEEVHAVLTHLSIESCVMFGHSMGGYVTLAYAEKFPEHLMGVGLFHSTAYADKEEKKLNRDKGAEFVQKHGTPTFVQTLIPSLFAPQNQEPYASTIKQLLEDAGSIPAANVAKALMAMKTRPDRTHVLKEVTCPVLFLIGKQDGVIPLEDAVTQSAMPPDGVAYYWNEVAHMGMYEASEKALKATQAFVEYCTTTARG